MIIAKSGIQGLYTGWGLHFIRDTSGTALYFAEYDVMRYILGRKRNVDSGGGSKGKGREDEQGEVPEWARSWLPKGIIPFVCGSVAGVTSWALIYPVDVSFLLIEMWMITDYDHRPSKYVYPGIAYLLEADLD